jgi:hypothetical protein
LIQLFFAKEWRRFRHSGGPWYARLTRDVSAALLCYLCTALRHVLVEWQNNDGRCPAKDPTHPRRMKSVEYTFSPSNDAGRPPPDFSTPAVADRSPAAYQQLVYPWNALRTVYRNRVREAIQVAVRDQLAEAYPTARAVPDYAPTGFSEAAMHRILAERAPVPEVSARPAVDLALSDVDAPAVPGAASATDDVADAFFGGDAGGSEADAPVDEPSPAASVGYLSSRGFCLADLVLSQPLPSRQSVASVRVCYLSCHVFALADGRSPAVIVVPDSRRCANVSCA